MEGHLLGGPRVLLPPELEQQGGELTPDRAQMMDHGVVARAKGDQQPLPGQSGPAMMHMQALPCPRPAADLAGAAIPLEDPRAQSGKVPPVMLLSGIAAGTETGG